MKGFRMNTSYKKIILAIIAGLLSVGWIHPLIKSFRQLCSWLYFSQQNNTDNIDSGVMLDLATGLFNVSMLWMALVLFVWLVFLFLKTGKNH